MDDKEKRKNDDGPRRYTWASKIKIILCLLILGVVLQKAGEFLELKVLIDWASPETQAKIDALIQAKAEPPEFISARFGHSPQSPICGYVDMKVLENYDAEDLIQWSEVSFNDHLLPADEVHIAVTDVNEHYGYYYPTEKFMLSAQTALELCFKRGLNENNHTGREYLMAISVRDQPTHEILAYEWIVGGCSCR